MALMFFISNTNWNYTYSYFECFVNFQTLHLIKFFVMQNLAKSKDFSQQQPILLNTLVGIIK